jgi:hypothetical protein
MIILKSHNSIPELCVLIKINTWILLLFSQAYASFISNTFE